MKRIVQTVICAILFVLPYFGFSQSTYNQTTDMDVNGVFIGSTYTKSQVEAKFGGIPTKYWSGMSEFGLEEEYYYTTNLFRFSYNGIFDTFNIKTSYFSVYTAFSGGIKVGDNISRISAIGLGTPVLQSNGTYTLLRGDWDDPLIFSHSSGVITQIRFVTSP